MKEKRIDNFTGTVTEIFNNQKLVIDGCEGILDFSDESVIIKSGRLKISVGGAFLKIILLSEYNIAIEGYISCVSYDYL